jgi:hypothetical protein
MNHNQAEAAALEARQSMIRVWLAISAVWITFWMLIAVVFAAFKADDLLVIHFSAFSFIVMTPPLLLLAIGAASRLVVHTIAPSRER